MTVFRIVLILALGAGRAAAQEEDSDPRAVHEKTRRSVVAVRAMAPLGERSGTGVLLDDQGTVLTSYSIVPEGAKQVRVWTAGPKLYSQSAEDVRILGHSKRDEITLLKVRPREGEKFTPVEPGGSSKLRIGSLCYTSGNASNSIINDDQPSFNAGILSAVYHLGEPRADSTYTGLVLETTAAVNVGMEGAPLLDRGGRMVGLVTLNYSPHRFLGCAIPMDGLRPVVEKLRSGGAAAVEPAPESAGTVGMKLADHHGGVVVESVDPEGAADRAGVRKGDTLVAVGEKVLHSASEFWEAVKELKAGAIVYVTVANDLGQEKTKIVLQEKRE